MADTGNGATLALGTTGAVGEIQSMTLPNWVSEMIESSHLGTTGFQEKIAGDLTDPGEIVATVIFDQAVAIPANGVIEDGTVTWPILNSTNTTNATLVGSGVVRAYQLPEMANETLQVATLTFAYDGVGTPPAFTVESA